MKQVQVFPALPVYGSFIISRKVFAMRKLIKPLRIILPVSLVLTFITAAVLLFTPFGYPAVKAATYDFGFFDFRFSYTADNVMTVLSHYNGDRTAELTRFYVIDFILAFFAAVFCVTLPMTFYSKNDKHYLLFRASAFSGLMAFIFNVIENILLLRIVNVMPYFSEGDADLASGITSLKWVFIGIWLLTTLLFIITTVISDNKKARGRQR